MEDIQTTIHLPTRLAEQITDHIKEGWFSDLNSLIVEALRRYLDAHQGEITTHFIREDVTWGLRGNE